MAALRPDQAKTGAAGAIIGTPGTQVTPRPAGTRSTPVARPSRSGPGTCSGSRRFAAASRSGPGRSMSPSRSRLKRLRRNRPRELPHRERARDNNVRSERLLDAGGTRSSRSVLKAWTARP